MEKYTDVYQRVTDIVTAKLESGLVPWQRPWDIETGIPTNLISKRPYQGINVLLLSSLEFESQYFLSFKQARELGGSVKKGEKACLVVFKKWIEATDQDGNIIYNEKGNPKNIPMLRYYYVFNIQQCAGIPEDKIPKKEQKERKHVPTMEAEAIATKMPNRPKIKYGSQKASYSPTEDIVSMPRKELFHSTEELYSTLFHEMVHSTGHSSRLDRPGVMKSSGFGSDEYSREELVAEMGAAFLCANAGIEGSTINNSASYISSWLERLKKDKRLVVIAAGTAQKACDFILNKKEKESENEGNGFGEKSKAA